MNAGNFVMGERHECSALGCDMVVGANLFALVTDVVRMNSHLQGLHECWQFCNGRKTWVYRNWGKLKDQI
jgi:hypothetical protein